MISAGLEKLVWQGKAIFKNWSFAFGQCGGIPINENQVCIITGFTWFGCLLVNAQSAGIDAAPQVHLFRIESDKNVNDYVIRDHFSKTKLTKPPENYIYNFGNVYFNSYIVAFKSIQLRIAIIPDYRRMTFVNGIAPGEANEPRNPLGYATDDILLNMNTPVCSYNPLADRNETTPGDRQQFNVNFEDKTKPDLTRSTNLYDNSGYPIVNLELVYVEKAFVNELLSSK